jgi:hypothetical protein
VFTYVVCAVCRFVCAVCCAQTAQPNHIKPHTHTAHTKPNRITYTKSHTAVTTQRTHRTHNAHSAHTKRTHRTHRTFTAYTPHTPHKPMFAKISRCEVIVCAVSVLSVCGERAVCAVFAVCGVCCVCGRCLVYECCCVSFACAVRAVRQCVRHVWCLQ